MTRQDGQRPRRSLGLSRPVHAPKAPVIGFVGQVVILAGSILEPLPVQDAHVATPVLDQPGLLEHAGRDRDRGASGYLCPRRGGPLWELLDGHVRAFECRIGDRFSQAELWIEHSAARNRAPLMAARTVVEHAALARHLADMAEGRGDTDVAARLNEEARNEDRVYAQVRAALAGLPEAELDATA